MPTSLDDGTIGDVTRLVNPAKRTRRRAFNPIYKMPLAYQ